MEKSASGGYKDIKRGLRQCNFSVIVFVSAVFDAYATYNC